jgi:hypothetical protein
MPSFMKQLQATAEAAICAVENRKRKQCDIELSQVLYQHGGRRKPRKKIASRN